MSSPPRVALFTDSFHEANGVGTLTRELANFARSRNLPFCCVHGGQTTQTTYEGSLVTIELRRSFASFQLDRDLYCDPLLSRYRNRVVEIVRAFKPDVLHISGPGDLGILGFWVAYLLRIPLTASWHTNLHEYLYRRLYQFFSFAPHGVRNGIASSVQSLSLRALAAFYQRPEFLFAPNEATREMLVVRTRRPCFLMAHGVDTQRFSPTVRARSDETFCIGYVGRLTPEKNVRMFATLERDLLAAGQTNFRIVLVGEGSEREWLLKSLRHAELKGVLRGDDLAAAYARMDVFVFPSETDTFGLVMLEALASGVPVVAGREAGIRAGVQHEINGLLTEDFVACVLQLMNDRSGRDRMACNARRFAITKSWDTVFQDLYSTYELALARPDVICKTNPKKRTWPLQFRKT